MKLWTAPDDQPVRRRDHRARAAVPGDHHPRRRPLEIRHPRRRPLPAVDPVHPAGRRLGRSDAAAADPHRGGRCARRPAASIPIAFVGGWLTLIQVYVVSFLAGDVRGLLRRRLPVVPAEHRRARRAGRGQLEARALPRRVIGRRADRRRLPDPGDPGPHRASSSMRELPRRGVSSSAHPARRAGCRSRTTRRRQAPEHVAGGASRARLRLLEPYLRNIAACTGTANLFGNIGGAVLHPLLYVDEEPGPERRDGSA